MFSHQTSLVLGYYVRQNMMNKQHHTAYVIKNILVLVEMDGALSQMNVNGSESPIQSCSFLGTRNTTQFTRSWLFHMQHEKIGCFCLSQP